MSFPRYSEYKDSGVEWLGEVPAHWATPPLFLRYSCELGKMLDASRITGESSVPYLRNVDVQWGDINFDELPEMDIEASEYARYTIRPGDLLVCEGGEVGRTAIVPIFSGTIGFQKALHRLRANSDDEQPTFMYYCFKWAAEHGVFDLNGISTIAHLTGEQLRKCRLPKPPKHEQSVIAAFLDHETAKIDALVAEQEKLIALLKEKRQAVISHAVTKGLNPDAPMKDSGIEWLGEVPAHWEVSRIANLFREIAEPGTDELPILSVSIHHGVSDNEIDEEDMERKVTRSDDRSKYKLVAPGDLVYNMMRAWQGGFGTVAVEGMVSPAYVVARPRKALETAYIEHLLRTPHAVEQMRRHSRGVTDFRLRLYWDEFKNIRVALPPQEEATAICAKIAEMEERFGAMSVACEESINLLQERRSALISAAVTGKIDVRGFSDQRAAA